MLMFQVFSWMTSYWNGSQHLLSNTTWFLPSSSVHHLKPIWSHHESRDPSWFPRPPWRDGFASHMSFLVVDDLGSWSSRSVPQGVDTLTQKTMIFSSQIMYHHDWGLIRWIYAGFLLAIWCFFLPILGFELNFTSNPSIQGYQLPLLAGCWSQSWGFSTFLILHNLQHEFRTSSPNSPNAAV